MSKSGKRKAMGGRIGRGLHGLLRHMGAWLAWWLVFRPSMRELVPLLAADALLLHSAFVVESHAFGRVFRGTDLFAPFVRMPAIEALPTTDLARLIRNLLAHPARRAGWLTLCALIRVCVCSLVIAVYWAHPISFEGALLEAMACAVVALAYLYGSSFFDEEKRALAVFEALRLRMDLNAAMLKFVAAGGRKRFDARDLAEVGAIWAFVIGMQALLAATLTRGDGGAAVWLEIGLVVAASMTLMTRVWLAGKRGVRDAIEAGLALLGPAERPVRGQALRPRGTSEAMFELGEAAAATSRRLREAQRDAESIAVAHAQRNRFETLGEMSTLVAHDLSGPLQTVRFCVEEIRDHPELAEDDRYIQRLLSGSERSLQLVNAVKALARRAPALAGAVVSEAHQHAVKLLEVRYSEAAFASVAFELSPAIATAAVALAISDLVHVLLNLYTNALDNLLANVVPSACIEILLLRLDETQVTIGVRDNGTGFASAAFEAITGREAVAPVGGVLPAVTGSGLGLMLTRRLVERAGGSLGVEAASPNGTTVALTLLRSVAGAGGRILPIEPLRG